MLIQPRNRILNTFWTPGPGTQPVLHNFMKPGQSLLISEGKMFQRIGVMAQKALY